MNVGQIKVALERVPDNTPVLAKHGASGIYYELDAWPLNNEGLDKATGEEEGGAVLDMKVGTKFFRMSLD